MDELTEHAEKHCSHLTKDNYYWLVNMVNLLANQPNGVPTFYHSRYCLYDAQGNVDTKQLLGHLTEHMSELYANNRGLEPIRVNIKKAG